MPRLLDETYLSPAPSLLAWWEQRDKCGTCSFLAGSSERLKDGMRCTLRPPNRAKSPEVTYGHEFCIDERANPDSCGPTAVHWKPAAPAVSPSKDFEETGRGT